MRDYHSKYFRVPNDLVVQDFSNDRSALIQIVVNTNSGDMLNTNAVPGQYRRYCSIVADVLILKLDNCI